MRFTIKRKLIMLVVFSILIIFGLGNVGNFIQKENQKNIDIIEKTNEIELLLRKNIQAES